MDGEGVLLPLSKGKFAIIDEADFGLVGNTKWSITNGGGYEYAHTSLGIDGKRVCVRLHRMIMGAKKGEVVDHVNGNTLDNRRVNLRICTRAQNARNRHRPNMKKGKTSKFKGVMWEPRYNHWYSLIGFNYKQIYLGSFKTEEMAALAYDNKAKELFGEFANPNFKGGAN